VTGRMTCGSHGSRTCRWEQGTPDDARAALGAGLTTCRQSRSDRVMRSPWTARGNAVAADLLGVADHAHYLAVRPGHAHFSKVHAPDPVGSLAHQVHRRPVEYGQVTTPHPDEPASTRSSRAGGTSCASRATAAGISVRCRARPIASTSSRGEQLDHGAGVRGQGSGRHGRRVSPATAE
jgi:hypothetical protein